MFTSLLSSNKSGRQRVSTIRVWSAWSVRVAFFLLAFSFSAIAQTALTERAGSSDVDASMKELSRPAQSQPVIGSPAESQLIRIVRFGTKAESGIKSQAPTGAHLTYFGGPVISNIQVVVVLWGPNVVTTSPADGTQTLAQFYTDITASRYFDELTEYTTAGIVGSNGTSTSNQTIGHGTFGGQFTITPSVCPGTAACAVSDAAIKTELTNQINAGHLPAPQSDAHGIVNTYYAIYFPPNVTIALDAIQSCVAGGFCAYHSNTGSLVPYGVMPDFSSGGCSLGCGGGTTFQKATAVSSHEMAEAITDAEVGSASVFGPPLAWYDDPPDQGEIADLCDPFDVTVNAGANAYTVEMLFSNVQNRCVSGPPVFSMPSPAGGAGPGIPFNMTLTVRYNDSSIITPLNYLGTVHFTSSDLGATKPADYTFTAADAGVHTFPFTLTLLGNQTITVTDTHSSGFTGTTTVNVNTIPDLGIDMHHTGNFGRTETGFYTITASNGGGGPTSGTVTVVDTLPIGITGAAMSGTGWSCTLATLTCTRADALAPENSYPPITLTVNVSTNTSTTETNIATISGGGETDTANDVAADVTTIVNPGVDLGVAITPFQLFASQGDTGATYAISVVNGGSDASSGTVSVITTLPAGLTATAISGTGWTCTLANLTCTRSDALASALNYPGITVTFSAALNAPLGFSSVSTTVSGGGDIDPANNMVNTSLEINAFLGIFSGGSTVTVKAGQPAKYVLGVFATAAAGTVTFSCSGLPASSSCSFNPSSLSNNSLFVTMTVTTTARTAGAFNQRLDNRNPWLWLGLLSIASMAALSLRLRAMPDRRKRLVPIFGTFILLVVAMLPGCGGGGGGTTIATNAVAGTPAGTYVITFTATSTSGAASRTMNLVVQ